MDAKLLLVFLILIVSCCIDTGQKPGISIDYGNKSENKSLEFNTYSYGDDFIFSLPAWEPETEEGFFAEVRKGSSHLRFREIRLNENYSAFQNLFFQTDALYKHSEQEDVKLIRSKISEGYVIFEFLDNVSFPSYVQKFAVMMCNDRVIELEAEAPEYSFEKNSEIFSKVIESMICLRKGKNETWPDLNYTHADFRRGIGLVPPNVPYFTELDVLDSFEKIREGASIVVSFSSAWQYPESFYGSFIASKLAGLDMVIIPRISEISIFNLNGSIENYSDPKMKESYADIAKLYKPKYMAIGENVNLYPEDFVSFYNETYDLIKEVSPNTKVFPVFSYEEMVKKGDWKIIEQYGSRIDLLAFISYPSEIYRQGIPDNYYSQIKNHTNLTVAFTEIGWGCDTFLGDSELIQANFVPLFVNLTQDLDIEFVSWGFLHNTPASGAPTLAYPLQWSFGLFYRDGRPKPVWYVWKRLRD